MECLILLELVGKKLPWGTWTFWCLRKHAKPGIALPSTLPGAVPALSPFPWLEEGNNLREQLRVRRRRALKIGGQAEVGHPLYLLPTWGDWGSPSQQIIWGLELLGKHKYQHLHFIVLIDFWILAEEAILKWSNHTFLPYHEVSISSLGFPHFLRVCGCFGCALPICLLASDFLTVTAALFSKLGTMKRSLPLHRPPAEFQQNAIISYRETADSITCKF